MLACRPIHTIDAGAHCSDGQIAVSMAVSHGVADKISIKNRMLQLHYIYWHAISSDCCAVLPSGARGEQA